MDNKYLKIVLFLVALALIAAAPAYQSFTPFANIRVDHESQLNNLDVSGAATFDSTADFNGAVTFDGGQTLNGDVVLENGETIGNGTDGIISLGGGLGLNSTHITGTQELTPTVYSHYVVNSSAEITLTLNACATPGPLFIYGDDNNTINIADSNLRTSDGDGLAIGQYDTVFLLCNGTEWGLVAEANNQ